MFDFHGSGQLSRRLRVSLGVFWGRWGLPLPRKTDIIALVGAPIPVVQVLTALLRDPEPDRIMARSLGVSKS